MKASKESDEMMAVVESAHQKLMRARERPEDEEYLQLADTHYKNILSKVQSSDLEGGRRSGKRKSWSSSQLTVGKELGVTCLCLFVLLCFFLRLCVFVCIFLCVFVCMFAATGNL